MGLNPFLNKLDIIAYSAFFIAMNMPLDRKKIGYAGKMNEHILRYFEPKSITVLSVEKKLIIKSDNMNRNIPDTIIIKKEYFIDVK
tara:strand:+ start:578 stop:835 length:258 start_codon:yes stop_codon:yes gene_type:complete